MFETIVALATAPIKSALAVIRLSGDDVFEVVNKCCKKDILEIKERTIVYTSIVDEEEKIDDVILLLYRAPKSFTGEDSIEIICHGSPLICKQIIEVCLKNGARMATNGEFSSRAFMHNKIDLVQAEAINDVINSTTREASRLNLLSLDGKTSELLKPIKTQLADIISLIEVNIDYPEYEDIEVANKNKVMTVCESLIKRIDELIDDGEKAQIINEGIKVAIVGKPNVGKSSLLNALLGEDRAIVTDIAGTTRDVVRGEANIGGVVLHLFDTAGIHDSNNLIETIGIEKTKKTIRDADVVVVVLDGSADISDEDQKILDYVKEYQPIIVYNKADIAKKKGKLCISALNNDIEPLIDEIKKRIGIDEKVFSTPALNNTRQIGLLKKARESLIKAYQDAEEDLTIDLISTSLFDAYTSVLEILGEANQIDLAKEIFSRFCVGK
ncbi:MAG TPA: tRNA uridine-5-carboxymethylaminomethyl(34) synthesis GTPase MnmE [Erysipelotrichaceae bacterium]|nr:tRNA uridine-5-carboxymethylaminomethyl(34) synthesis GTPase MnmE [Erysipelotrichaceae bacterium]